MTLPKNEKPRSKPEKKLKPVRAWAVVQGARLAYDQPYDFIVTKRRKDAARIADESVGERVVRVLITELD